MKVNTKDRIFRELYKVVLLGDAAVGKTTIRKKFAEGMTSKRYIMTIGVEVSTKDVALIYNGKPRKVTLVIWDLGGQLYFTRMRSSFYQGTSGAILMYDVSNRKTFENLTSWINEIKSFISDAPLVLVGNKIDLRDPKSSEYISKEDGIRKAKEIDGLHKGTVNFIETSALYGQNVEEAFLLLTREILDFENQKRKLL